MSDWPIPERAQQELSQRPRVPLGPFGQISLPADKQELVRDASERRYARNLPKEHRWGMSRSEWTLERLLDALGGENAVGLAIGREWVDTETPDYHGDLGEGVQVRHTDKDYGRLLLHFDGDRPDREDHDFFLVVGKFPDYRVVGWIHGADAKRVAVVRQLKPGRAAPWCVEQVQLRPVSEWLG